MRSRQPAERPQPRGEAIDDELRRRRLDVVAGQASGDDLCFAHQYAVLDVPELRQQSDQLAEMRVESADAREALAEQAAQFVEIGIELDLGRLALLLLERGD